MVKPAFDYEPVCDLITVDYKNASSTKGIYQCQLPMYKPSSIGNKAELKITNGLDNNFMYYNKDNRTISVILSKIEQSDCKSYFISLEITDDANVKI